MKNYTLILFFWPPVGASVWWLLSQGWAKIVQGGTISQKTIKRQRTEFWVLLVAAYVLGIVIGTTQHKF
jgi:hypothetical protein